MWEGLIQVQADPHVTVPTVRDLSSDLAGIACPDCLAETGWNRFEWLVFLAGISGGEGEGEDC